MMFSKNSQSTNQSEKWRLQLKQFVKANQQELAALAWGLSLEWGDRNDTLGIDLKPTPHFVVCSREAIEQLNHNVDNHFREILGILDGYNQENEVVMIAIGNGQISLINFKPELSPAECFANLEQDLESLIASLEQKMTQTISI